MPAVHLTAPVKQRARAHNRIRTRVRTRLPVTPDNLVDSLGRYHRVQVNDGTVLYKRADYSTPVAGWAVTANLGVGQEPTLAEDSRELNLRVLVAYSRQHTVDSGWDVWERYSDDDGETWEPEVMSIPGGTHPRVKHDPYTRATLRAAYVGGQINATWQGPADDAPSAPFPFVDSTGAPLAVADDGFGLTIGVPPNSGQMQWILTVTIDGETEPSDWVSEQEYHADLPSMSWERV